LRANEGRKNGSKTAGCQINSHRFVATSFFLPLDAGLKILLTEQDDKEKNFLRKKNLAFPNPSGAVAEMLCA
jgi:hypothetical protein